MNDHFTVSQTARELGVSAEYVRVLTRSGRLPCEVTPYGRLISASDVARIKSEREQKKDAKAS